MAHGGGRARHAYLPPELLSELRDLSQRFFQARFVALHATVVPHEASELSMDRIHGARAVEIEEAVDA